MADESNERKVIIAILLTSTLLTMLGIAGVLRGAYDLSLAPLPEDVRELYDPEDEVTDAEVQLLEAQVTNPYRRPLAAANVVVSALVLIGSFMLSWRRKLALWWIRNTQVERSPKSWQASSSSARSVEPYTWPRPTEPHAPTSGSLSHPTPSPEA
ncbi:MAG: hypothetical protein JRF55_10570 [Deltaproteobacteria bacterium]|nr:hypothetical protein [Deltaproteobacteria bacterium]